MFHCPRCHSTENFTVSGTALVEISVYQFSNDTPHHAVDLVHDVVWEDDSAIVCRACFHEDTARAFTIEDAETVESGDSTISQENTTLTARDIKHTIALISAVLESDLTGPDA